MSIPMPQTVADRIFAFMLTEKTGQIVMDFRAGRLLSFKVIEYCRLDGVAQHGDEPGRLDITELLTQDSGT